MNGNENIAYINENWYTFLPFSCELKWGLEKMIDMNKDDNAIYKL